MSSRMQDLNYSDDEQFECADAGAANTFPTPAGDLKKGDFVVIRGHACKVHDTSVVKGGKHGHTKAHLEGADIFTGQKLEIVAPSSFGMPCPVVTKTEFQLIDIDLDDGHRLTLLDDDCEQREDLDLPFKDNEPLARAIRAHFAAGKDLLLVAHKAMGIEQVMSFKFASAGK